MRKKEGKMPKLLIVEDEVDTREFAKNFFSKRDIDVFSAGNGEDALRLIDQENPDLVLLDVNMGTMSGLDVLKKLRENKNDVAVIMVTGNEEEEVVSEANSWGIKGYVHKPLILEELEEIVMAELKIK